MKILQIGGTFVGAQKIIEGEIHRYLISHGHESHILYAIGESDDKNIVCYETRPENFLRRVFCKFFGNNPKYARPQTKRIIQYIKKWKPDVVHLHVLHHGYTDYIFLLQFLAQINVGVVFTMHDMWWETGGCYYYTALGCDGYRRGCRNCPAKAGTLDCKPEKTAAYFLIKTELYRKLFNPHFVAVSPWVYEESQKTVLSQYPMHTVWNSVQVPGASDIPAMILPKAKEKCFRILGVAACWDQRKGIGRFWRLAELLGDSYEILLVGAVSDDIKKTAPRNVTLLGRVNDRSTLFSLYSEADLHVSMSMEETFGLTFIEAAFAGTRSMGFDSTAIPQVIEKVFGYVIEKNNIASMAAKISHLATHREECKLTPEEMSAVKKFFSSEHMACEYCDIYKSTLM